MCRINADTLEFEFNEDKDVFVSLSNRNECQLLKKETGVIAPLYSR